MSDPPSKPFTIVKERELWATQQQFGFVGEALQWYGEQVVVRLLWRWEDADAGLVEYCKFCQATPNPLSPDNSVQSRVSAVYKQSGNVWCEQCFGTTFVGGFKPVIYHLYMLASDTPEVRRRLDTGNFWQETPQVDFSGQPQLRTGDLVIRVLQWDPTNSYPTQSGQRWTVTTVEPQTVRTGPGPSTDNVIRVAQRTTLETIPENHPYNMVPFESDNRGFSGLP